ncbi:hypothetical protein, variant 1 [Cryptococcus amylolentus CBS 6039]|uniref:Rubisco LSMT substrate-binding domain-containing protein n=2 Tax=Cryptococcus amylolentus CBS 6039 TaxID=1295533 RepID=A0A1E3HW58_9TREE|nr:hypothetical protein, variant 1 [Cryptococcus amylolentus CBS 6039]ODN80552.1 hypothetical protein, variant 1 [Cryptococcus amylolentus CBS 6039]
MSTEQATGFDRDQFLSWFKGAGGWYNETAVDLIPYPGMNYGATALEDIKEDAPLFHIPDSLILSPYTSTLKEHLSSEEWEQLGHGWSQLILVMMWESIRGDESRWSGYLGNMPRQFETPMFWSEEERKYLAGTDIQDRIGREDAEQEYTNVLLPVISAHPELFPVGSPHTSIDAFHLQGSRILSRSFTVPLSRFDNTPKAAEQPEDSDDEEEEDQGVVVMMPFADMLNAAYEKDNAHLFVDEEASEEFKSGVMMRSTKKITKSQQIFNTYDAPPNSELLRKYGHVDVLPLLKDITKLLKSSKVGAEWPFGNAGDEVLLSGEAIVESVAETLGEKADDKWRDDIKTRIDWWLEEGQEDAFPLGYDEEIDDGLISFARLLSNDEDWEKAQKKSKPPKPTVDGDVAAIIIKAIEQRESTYEGAIEDDIATLKASTQWSAINSPDALKSDETPVSQQRKEMAAVVKLGERRILKIASHVIKKAVKTEAAASKKRKAGSVMVGKGKKLS